MTDLVLHCDVPRGPVRAAVLLLHGGRSESPEPVSARQASVVRLIPFARRLRSAGGPLGLAVWRLRYRVRGWNGPAESPLADVREALDAVRERHPGAPLALVGYSMGGRAAVRVAADPAVVAVAGLAPWITPTESPETLSGRHVLLMHGAADRTTDPRATAEFAERARPVAASCTFVSVPGAGHALLRRPGTWHRLTTEFVLQHTGLAGTAQRRRR